MAELDFRDLVPKAPTEPSSGGGLDFSDLVPKSQNMVPSLSEGIRSTMQRVTGSEAAGEGAVRGVSNTPIVGPLVDLVSSPSMRTALYNAPASALHVGQSMAHAVMHPIETAQNIGNVGLGAAEKAGLSPTTGHEQYADAVGKMFANRYGGMENLKKTFETDPVGVMMDFSTVMGGVGAGARLPGVLGEIAETAGTIGRVTDPLSAVGAVAKGAGAVGSEIIGGIGTQTGGQSLRTAYTAGQAGGESAAAYQRALRNTGRSAEPVEAAQQGLANIAAERGNVFREKMTELEARNKDPLNFDEIDKAVDKIKEVGTFHGQDISPSTAAKRLEIMQVINDWKTLDPQVYHTAMGLDALKKRIGDLYEGTVQGSRERKVVNDTYNAVKNTIVKQDPEYAKIMNAYSSTSKTLDELTRGLSLGERATVDTALRKLQSVLRDNVSTAYNRRAELANYLVSAGSPQLMELLAGQALHPWLPRGLGKLVGAIAGERAIEGALGWKAIAATPFLSPRMMGESAYYLGRASPYGRPAGQAAFQAGRYPNPFANTP